MKATLPLRESASSLPKGSNDVPLTVTRHLKKCVADFHPAYFAMAMATGIISIDCHLLGLREFARLLYWMNIPIYGILWAVTIARAVFFPGRFRDDLSSHQRGPGFFTCVAATGVIGVQMVMLGGSQQAGRAMWWFGLVLWAVCTYTIFLLLSVKEKKPPLDEGINGGWLVAVVATQSICVLGCIAGPVLFADRNVTLFVLMSFWLCGGMLYIWMISLIFYRYMFFRFSPSDLMPPYWINMGAVAISTLAGTALVFSARDSSLLAPLLPFVKGLTLMFWATATWWIPMLLILGIWRHHTRRLAVVYDPLYWGLVFPIGMYSVCTYQLSRLFHVPFLQGIAAGFAVAGLIAWMFAFLGMAKWILYVLLLTMRSLQMVGPRPDFARPVVQNKGGGSHEDQCDEEKCARGQLRTGETIGL